MSESIRSRIHKYARLGKFSSFKKLILEDGIDINSVDKRGNVAAHYAAQKGNLKMLKFILANGGDVHWLGLQNCMPIHVACLNGHVEVVDFLLDNGANINAVDSRNCTPLFFAEEHFDVASLLVKRGANVHHLNEVKNTVLHNVCHMGHFKIAKMLIENGANIMAASNSQKFTPLHCATNKGNVEVAKLLLRKGASVNILDSTGATPLHKVFRFRNNVPRDVRITLMLELVIFGSKIDTALIHLNTTMGPYGMKRIASRLNMLEQGKKPLNLFSQEEKRYLIYLAICFDKSIIPIELFHNVFSFMTFKGIFMASGYGIGNKNIWKQPEGWDEDIEDCPIEVRPYDVGEMIPNACREDVMRVLMALAEMRERMGQVEQRRQEQ